MGVGLLEIGVQMRKVVIFSIRLCYRTVRNHPFLVGMLCFLALLYRSFPFLFSVLVSVSPVIVCTAILLGTLLSFGHQNAPEIEREEKTVHDILVPLKSGVSCDDASVVEKDESYSVERYIDKRWDAAEQPFYEVERDNRFGDGTPLIEKESQEIQPVNSVFDEAARFCYDSGSEQKNENVDVLEYQYSPIPNTDDNNLEFDVDNDKSVDSYDSKMVNIGSHPGSPGEEEEEDREEDESIDSGSDRAESSPDASMANIIPMLDEFHPLLDEGNPQRVNLSDADFDAEFKHSKLSDSEDEFTDGISNQGELETADDENEDDEDEEDIQGDKEEGDRFGIAWTEDDQKIIMDLGSSELERNQRLESLIAKRKAQKNMKALAERSGELETADDENEDDEDEDEEDIHGDKEEGDRFGITWTEDDQKSIMDLGSSELERNQRLESLIAKRKAQKNMKALAERNLIDLGSVDLPFNVAPISTARKNPFDIPDDQNDLRLPPIPGSAPSILLPRRNPFDLPYDVGEEKPDSVEDSFQKEFMTLQPKEPFFRRHESFNVQPSLFGPNKQVQDDIRLRPYFVPERMEIDGPSYTPFERQLSDLSDSKVSSIPETESSGSVSDLEENDLTEENIVGKNLNDKDLVDENIIDQHISQELDVMSSIEPVGHVSSFSEEELLELGRNGKKDLFGVKIEFKQNHEEIHHDENPSLIQEGNVANMLDFSSIETNSRSPSFKQKSNWHSSSSSPSEASEKILDERGAQWLSGLEERSGHAEEKVISREPSSEKSDVNITTITTDENPHREPIYDSSPAPLQKHISLSSISSDVRTDSLSSISSDVRADSEMGFSPPSVRAALAFADRESMQSGLKINKYTPINEEILATSTTSVAVHKVESLSADPMDINMQEVLKLNSSEINEAYFDAFTPAVAESVVSKVFLDSKASLGTSEDDKIIELLQDESLFSVFNPNVKASNGVDLMMESVSKSKEPFSTAEEFYLVQQSYNLPPRDHKEVQQEQPLIVVETIGEAGLTATPASVLHKVDEATGEVSQSDIKKSAFDEVEVANHIQGSENHELLLETVECRGDVQHLIEDTDCIKDVSEELLSELDAVGDFSIKEPGSSLIENEIEFEGRSTEDIDLDHRQLHEDNSKRHFLHDSVDMEVKTAESSVLVLPQALEANLEKFMELNSKDGLLEAGPDEGDSFKGVESTLKAFDVPEGSKVESGKLHYEVDRSEDSHLATASEPAHHEAPVHNSSSIIDVKDKKKEDSLKSDSSSSSSSDSSSSDSDKE
ncbi:PREDICTED: probable serine/threonine-protein kinase kinX isoform X4 [Ipomoea nil]|uniref:probable serine/threonine-protein kinase kinX isoform X4 n=1 Tax=Ipomoea nil TaxID=35883 RepID=UPI00090195B7|nr:PREDICTED: probable serine/threonine-protein kinase kinX isoform X4 [Ipomoea nil]